MFYELGNEAFDKGDFEKAIKYYNDALESENNTYEILLNLSLCYYEVKDYSSSIEISNKLINSNNSSYSTEALFNRGNCYQKLCDYEKAEEDFSMIISLFPFDPDAHYNRANAREKLNNAIGAKKDRRIAEIIEEKIDNNFYTAPSVNNIDSYSLDKFTDDKAKLIKEINLNPNSYSLHFELGNTYAKIREFKKAMTSFSKFSVSSCLNSMRLVSVILYDLFCKVLLFSFFLCPLLQCFGNSFTGSLQRFAYL